MAMVVIAICLLVCMTVWINVYGQECLNQPCKCCVVPDTSCEYKHPSHDYCLDGCRDGIWGNRCYNPCQGNCATCSQGSSDRGYPCTSCIPGAYGSTSCDYNCPDECATCTFKSYDGYPCTKCKDNSKYGNKCTVSCSAGCVNGECNTYGICNCKAGYSGNKCDVVDCPNNCQTCSSPSECQTCVGGFYNGYKYDKAPSEYTRVCKHPCRQNCKTCTKYYSCTSCDLGYYGQYCQQSCAVGCVWGRCIRNGSCNCKAGYSGNKCDIIDCPNNCQTCSSPSECQTCVDGYYNGNNIYNEYTSVCTHTCKTNTAQHCKSCTGYSSCNQCDDGYYGDFCGTPCSSGCQRGTCNKESGQCDCKSGFSGYKCDQCIPGKYSDNCNLNCLSQDCNYNYCHRNSGRCSSCNPGYYGNDLCNQSCSTSCQYGTCDFTLGTCDCITGYSGDKCCLNNDNCDKCLSPTQCSKCKSGYSGDKCCVNSNHCETCSSSTRCSKCKSGYSGDKCCVNNDRCITCASPSACSQCKPGYSGDKCCIQNNFCELCSSNTECSKCKDSRHGITCTETCPENCNELSCHRDGTCVSCRIGYYGTKCENECHQNCIKCDGNGECTSCVEGYYGPSCIKCLANCARCKSSDICDDCIDGYFGNDCASCPNNCVTCNSQRRCRSCKSGYHGSSCKTKCSDCKVGTKCRQGNGYCEEACIDGKYDTSCSRKCYVGCAACQRHNKYECTVCANGRYGEHKSKPHLKCNNECSSNCFNKTCNGSTGYCDTCIEGYKGELCDCPINCQCAKSGKCKSCDDNFANMNMNCTECALHKYGEVCQSECSNNCLDNDNNTMCNGTNGTCIVGCVNSFYGDKCDLSCDENCVKGTCSRLYGICSYGCQDGFTDYGAECVIAAASADPDNGGSSGSVIGGSLVGIIALIAGVLVFVFVRRRRANNGKCSSQHTNEGRQNHSNNISDSVLGYDNTTESVNMNTADADENINNVVQPASNTNYNKSPVQPNPKAEHERKSNRLGDLRKSVKSDFLQISAQSQYMRKSTKSVASNHKLEIEFDDVDNEDVIPSSTATEGNYGYYNLAELKRGIPVAKLADLVAKRDTASFEQEFKEFDNGLVRPYLDSQKPQNRARNRYQHIYPYDEHRVHLQGSSTDYINASYIDGYQHPKEYIACLGPTEKATEDFAIVWMMIWEQKVEQIVMVTNLFENAAMKCEQYWPDVTTSLNYGDVTVTCHSEDEYADYTLRSFTVSKGSENRSLHHIHYTAWPDKGVPDNVTSIIEFRQRVNSIQTKLKGPVIVHCSAGIGRTGTYIALDSLTKEGQYTQSVDIYGCVKKMREQRVNMVQTSEQYHYLHSAVVHSLTFDCAAVTAEQFNKHFNNMTDKTIEEKFKQLQLTVENRSEEETKAIAVNKKHKHLNHAGADIPGDYRRPKLHLNKDPGDCDYINAVFVNSFKTKNRFIVAMTPLPGTVLDFLTLLYQENCSCIVSLEAPESLNDKNVGTYYPADNQELKHDVFKVTCTKGVPSDSYVMRKLTITYNRQAESTSKKFTHFQFTKWSRRSHVLSDTATFLQLISDVEAKANATADNGPILIHCLNGASRSGLFCAVSILRQKMEIEHEVSVVNTVRYIKSRRPSAIPNKDQYAFCHQAVVAYLDTFDKDIYSNFSLKL